MFGATEEELVGKYNLFQDEVIEKNGFMPEIRRVFEKGEVADIVMDYSFRDVHHISVKNATNRTVKSILTPIFDTGGKVTNVVVQSLDLSEIKKAENDLKFSEEKFRTLTETIPGAVYKCDAKWTFLLASPAMESLTGYPASDFINNKVRSYIGIMVEDDIDPIEHTLEEACRRQEPFFFSEYRIKTKNGKIKWVHDSVRIIYDPNGVTIAYEGVYIGNNRSEDGRRSTS